MKTSFTKKERHEIYKEALKIACKDPDVEYGLCHLFESIPRVKNVWWKTYNLNILDLLPEVLKQKPLICRAFWFPLTYKGWEKRIAILEKGIEETKS